MTGDQNDQMMNSVLKRVYMCKEIHDFYYKTP